MINDNNKSTFSNAFLTFIELGFRLIGFPEAKNINFIGGLSEANMASPINGMGNFSDSSLIHSILKKN